MSRPLRRASVWLARHPTVLVAAVVLTTAVVVGVVGDVNVSGEVVAPVEVDFETTGIGSQTDGPNTVDDGGGS